MTTAYVVLLAIGITLWLLGLRREPDTEGDGRSGADISGNDLTLPGSRSERSDDYVLGGGVGGAEGEEGTPGPSDAHDGGIGGAEGGGEDVKRKEPSSLLRTLLCTGLVFLGGTGWIIAVASPGSHWARSLVPAVAVAGVAIGVVALLNKRS